MKSIMCAGIVAGLACGACIGGPEEKPFGPVGEAIVEVVADYIADSTHADEPFSVAVLSGALLDDRYVALPIAELATLKKRLPMRWRFYVPPAELRFPEANEKDPNDTEGKSYRGIEKKNGKRISVFVIRHIDYVSPQKLLVHWDYGSGPLAGVGGSLEVSREGGEWRLQSRVNYDR